MCVLNIYIIGSQPARPVTKEKNHRQEIGKNQKSFEVSRFWFTVLWKMNFFKVYEVYQHFWKLLLY